MKRIVPWLLIAVVLLFVASLVFAQPGGLTLPWHRIAAGGGTSSGGGRFVISGTIGQPEAGVLMEGSSFQMTGGYWGGATPAVAPNELYLPVVVGPG
jgi:hypothetical protein